jgi:uncharacterized damage-inducible protein DinB
MKRSLALPLLLLALLPSTSVAQAPDPMMTSARGLYEAGKRFILGTAEQSPAEDYAFRPAETVRTLGQILGHVADVHFLACSIALGESNPNTASVEQANPSKEQLLATLRRSYELCDRAYAQSDAAVTAPAELFGDQTTRFHALNLNVSHDFEHYGNLVTYVRMRDRVPPSSQPAQ